MDYPELPSGSSSSTTNDNSKQLVQNVDLEGACLWFDYDMFYDPEDAEDNANKDGSKVEMQLRKEKVSHQNIVLLQLLRDVANNNPVSIWLSKTLQWDLNLPMTTSPPDIPGFVQVFMLCVGYPPVLLSLYETDDSAIDVESYTEELAGELHDNILKYCCVDFHVLPCSMTCANFTASSLRATIELELKTVERYFKSPTLLLDQESFFKLKKATTALVGETFVLCLLESTQEEKLWLFLMGKKSRDALSELIERLHDDGRYEIVCRPDAPLNEKIVTLEAAKRISFTQDVNVKCAAAEEHSCLEQLQDHVHKMTDARLRLNVEMTEEPATRADATVERPPQRKVDDRIYGQLELPVVECPQQDCFIDGSPVHDNSRPCALCNDIQTASESEEKTWAKHDHTIQEINRKNFCEALDHLEESRIVILCGPPGAGRSALGRAILKHYAKRGFIPCNLNKDCSSCQQAFSKRKQSIVLIEDALGVVQVDTGKYYSFQEFVHNSQCVLVLTAYPHVLKDLAVLDACHYIPLLPAGVVIDIKPPSPGSGRVYSNPTADFLFQSMLDDSNYKDLAAALLALNMLGSYNIESDSPRLMSDLQRLGFQSVDNNKLKQLACNCRGSILAESGLGFACRDLYNAAGLALGNLYSRSVLLKVCDVSFLVQHVRTSGESEGSCVLIGPKGKEREVLMYRMYKMIVDGELSELCQHPSFECPDFMTDFEDFLMRKNNFVQQMLGAVDKEHGLSLLYWSLWSPSTRLTRWCLKRMDALRHLAERRDHSENFLSTAVAGILFAAQTETGTKITAKSLLKETILLKLKSVNVRLPVPGKCLTTETRKKRDTLKKCLQTKGPCYLDDPSLPIPATLLSVTVTEDAVSVELPRQHWYLALRLLADREVDETDRDGNTVLHLAAHTGHLEAITIAVKSGASLTVTNKRRQTPYHLAQRRRKARKHGLVPLSTSDLHEACKTGDIERVKVMLCHLSTVRDKENPSGLTLLHTACRAHMTEIVSLITHLGADPNAVLHDACESDDAHTVKILLELGARVNKVDNIKRTSLHYAAISGNTSVADCLLHNNADINAADSSLCTPLHVSCERGWYDLSLLLLDSGADINVKDSTETTCLHKAVRNGHDRVAHLLLQHQACVDTTDQNGWTPLHEACSRGAMEITYQLLNHGASVDITNNDGGTALHLACDTGFTGIARLLLQHNASVNMRDVDGATPLYKACGKGHTETASLLLQKGASVDLACNDRSTPLHKACIEGYDAIVQLLLQKDAKVVTADDEGCTALYRICMSGSTRMLRQFLQFAANATHADKKDLTSLSTPCGSVAKLNTYGSLLLHLACKYDDTTTVRLLLERGVHVNVKDGDGHTPLHIATLFDSKATIELLLQRGASTTAKSSDGYTPVYMANLFLRKDTADRLAQCNV